MSWIKACKQYQLQRGDGAKYVVPKKGTEEYNIVRKIYESMEKSQGVVEPPIKNVRVRVKKNNKEEVNNDTTPPITVS